MGNIITSYLRIRKTNDTHLSEEEIENLFRNLVNYHGEFGSYWVRVTKKYRQKEKCLDIQFGSGKSWYVNPADYISDNSELEIVKRECNEGARDTIQLFRYKNGGEYESEKRLCTYAFDKIQIVSNTNWLKDEGATLGDSTSYELNMTGTYYSANNRSFVDIDIYRKPPAPIYDEDYPYDYFVLTEADGFQFTGTPFLVDLTEGRFSRMPNNSKIVLYYKYRKVAVITKYYDNIEILTADYWDNCADEFCKDW